MKPRSKDGQSWRDMVAHMQGTKTHRVHIGLVGKYMGMKDTYLSVTEALKSAALANDADIEISWIDSESLEHQGIKTLEGLDGIVVPGGFGYRGIEGKILAAQYARENKIPYLGLCLGMQIATIEAARNLAGWKDANSTEFNKDSAHPVIHIMPDQEKKMLKQDYGGTMRLGAYQCQLLKGSHAEKAYKSGMISERHRHRYEFNNEFREELEKAGLVISGQSPDGIIVEIIEYKDHPFFVGTQFHPEFKSRPNIPHPLFRDFIATALKIVKINST